MHDIAKLAVIGSGTMGGGIAITAVTAGIDAVVIDMSDAALKGASARARKFLDRQVAKGRMAGGAADEALARMAVSTELADAAVADLVIEAVFEDLEVKRNVFTRLEPLVSRTCYLATNTSALKVSEIGRALVKPDRLCGLHYFSPAELNPVVEVVRGGDTGDDTITAAMSFLRRCGKLPIQCNDHSGFALNRFFCPYTNEAARCVDDGLGTPAQIDTVARDVFGAPIGPFAVMNIVKPRINLAAVRNLSHLGAFYAPAQSLCERGDADDNWELEDSPPALAPTRRDAIENRLKGAVFHAVREELSEGVASPTDIDLGARKAFAFREGPVEMMLKTPGHEVDAMIELVTRRISGRVPASQVKTL